MVANAIVPYRPREELDLQTMGEVLASSGFFSDAKQAAQAVTKILAGRELGIGPVASLTSIYLVKGNVTLSANLIAALIRRSQRYDYRVKSLTPEACELVFLAGGEVVGESTFTKADAVAAGLWGQPGPWKQYPRNMLFARAMSNGAKWFAPDLFSGPVYTPEELGAEVDGEGAPLVDLRTGEIVEQAPAPPARGLTPRLRGALADWHEEASRAQANGIDPIVRDLDTATAEELRESATRLRKLRQAAEAAGWPALVLKAELWDVPYTPLPELVTRRQLAAEVEALTDLLAEHEPAPEGDEDPEEDDEDEDDQPEDDEEEESI